MDITVSSPGSPGTSFTDNVKDKILIIFEVLASNDDFESVRALGAELEKHGLNWNYARNILPFMQNCGMVEYKDVDVIDNKRFFTNIGHTYIDILKAIKTAKAEPESQERNEIIHLLNRIQEVIYFQCMVLMMKNENCNYSYDFYDVLRFIKMYGSIDSTEYLLIQHERKKDPDSFLENMADTVSQYRSGELSINIKTKTKNDESGAAKSVNSFPYVNGNFMKAGVLRKGEDGRYFFCDDRLEEIETAIKEVEQCQSSAR